jgi:hypothetical protein
MFATGTDRHRRSELDIGQIFNQLLAEGFSNTGIGIKGKMWTVLLPGTNWDY